MLDRGTNTSHQLKQCLHSRRGPLRVVGAHDVLGVRLIEQAGFDAVWASGLEITTSRGCRDDDGSLLSDIVPTAQLLARRSGIPVIADAGTGGDTPKEIIALVHSLEHAGVAGLSLEDGQRPKSNSLLPGQHPLAPVDDFSEKIRAARRASKDSSFLIIARVEALIAHAGVAETSWRGRSYAAAGADAILIHSKATTPDEVLAFIEAWNEPVPLVLIPTTYHSVTVSDLLRTGKVRMVIYANQCMRASIRAMKRNLKAIMRDGTTHNVEHRIATLEEVFELQDTFEAVNGEATSPRVTPHNALFGHDIR